MKKIILLSFLALCAISCSEDSVTSPVAPENPSAQNPPQEENPEASIENKVLLLKVDYETNAFEGGVELVFPEADTFTISADYNAPGDFGDITLNYEEVGQPLFMGSIIWMGTGFMVYPCAITEPNGFETQNNAVPMPPVSQFEKVMYDEHAFYPAVIDYQTIWSNIDNLVQVQAYRQSNPNAKINLFLYTPSVGVGNPAEWDWYVILKN
jgi:hypothetical protein